MNSLILRSLKLLDNSWHATIWLSSSLQEEKSMLSWLFKIVSQKFCKFIQQFQEKHPNWHQISSILWAWNQTPIPLSVQMLPEKSWKLSSKTIVCRRAQFHHVFPTTLSWCAKWGRSKRLPGRYFCKQVLLPDPSSGLKHARMLQLPCPHSWKTVREKHVGNLPLEKSFLDPIICLVNWILSEPKMQESSSSARMQNLPFLLDGDWTLEWGIGGVLQFVLYSHLREDASSYPVSQFHDTEVYMPEHVTFPLASAAEAALKELDDPRLTELHDIDPVLVPFVDSEIKPKNS